MSTARAHPLRLAAPIAALLTVVVLARPAAGQVVDPSPQNHVVPCGIVLVPPGFQQSTFDFEVLARDLASQPMVGAEVRIDFTGCGGDARPASEQPPGIGIDCPTQSVFAITDAQGRATFRIVGGAGGGPPQAGSPQGCARIYVDGVLAAYVHTGVLDLDGADGLTIADLSIWLSDFFNHPWPPDYAQRSDYDYVQGGCLSEGLGTPDFSIWLGAFLSQSAVYGVPLCGP